MVHLRESAWRSAVKATSWRVLATLATFSLVFIWTGHLQTALSVGMLEVVLKLLLYYLHERAWLRIKFGQKTTKPAVLWFTGLSGSGKTTIGKALKDKLEALGLPVEWLDGDVTRDFLPQTGFSKEERNAHVIRTGFIARTLEKNGLFVVATYISPYRDAREKVRAMCSRFVEIHVATPLEECERRDVKGLYAKAREGKISQFTGIDDPYETPEHSDLVIDTMEESAEEASKRIIKFLAL